MAAINAEVSALAGRAGDHVLVALALDNLVEEELREGAGVPSPPPIDRDALDYAAELGMVRLAAHSG